MEMTEKVRHATNKELAEMPKSMFNAYEQGRLVVKALKTFVFHTVNPLQKGPVTPTRLEPGDYWSFWRPFWKDDELVVLSKKAEWYWEKAKAI